MRLRTLVTFGLLLPPWSSAVLHADDKTEVASVVVPFLAKHCVTCHGPEKKKADLALHVYKDEAALLKDRKKWQAVLQMVHTGEMPPESRPRPEPRETEAFIKFVESVLARADSGKRDPGRVTMRRLNRTEYNNTIRDLVGVDFQAAENFPSDDVGYGFDNIGDVLTLSPILMERYFAAADAIMHRAILVDLPKPPVRYQNAPYLEPGFAAPAGLRFRSVLPKKNLNTPYDLTQGGDFKLRVRAYAVPPDKNEKIRMAIEMDGTTLKTVEVAATDPKKPGTFEVAVHLDKGKHRAAVVLLNDFPVAKDAPHYKLPKGLFVEWISLEGPMDTRPDAQQQILAHPPGLAKKDATRAVLERFAGRAYRRPATQDEIDRLVRLVDKEQARGEKWEAAIQLALEAVLVSPKFLFRVELDDRADSARRIHSMSSSWRRGCRISCGAACRMTSCLRWLERKSCTKSLKPRSGACSRIPGPAPWWTISPRNGYKSAYSRTSLPTPNCFPISMNPCARP